MRSYELKQFRLDFVEDPDLYAVLRSEIALKGPATDAIQKILLNEDGESKQDVSRILRVIALRIQRGSSVQVEGGPSSTVSCGVSLNGSKTEAGSTISAHHSSPVPLFPSRPPSIRTKPPIGSHSSVSHAADEALRDAIERGYLPKPTSDEPPKFVSSKRSIPHISLDAFATATRGVVTAPASPTQSDGSSDPKVKLTKTVEAGPVAHLESDGNGPGAIVPFRYRKKEFTGIYEPGCHYHSTEIAPYTYHLPRSTVWAPGAAPPAYPSETTPYTSTSEGHGAATSSYASSSPWWHAASPPAPWWSTGGGMSGVSRPYTYGFGGYGLYANSAAMGSSSLYGAYGAYGTTGSVAYGSAYNGLSYSIPGAGAYRPSSFPSANVQPHATMSTWRCRGPRPEACMTGLNATTSAPATGAVTATVKSVSTSGFFSVDEERFEKLRTSLPWWADAAAPPAATTTQT